MRHILFKYPQTIENYTKYICCWDSSGPKVWLQAWMCHYLNLNFVIFMKSRSPWWVIISWSHKMKFTKSQNLMFNGETNPCVLEDVGCYLFIWFSFILTQTSDTREWVGLTSHWLLSRSWSSDWQSKVPGNWADINLATLIQDRQDRGLCLPDH